jgi:uncharacterized protein (TIGR02391 family)
MAAHPKLNGATIEQIAKIIGDTEYGLTGSQIGQLLLEQNIPDIAPSATKWKRLAIALETRQERDSCGNIPLAFVQVVMEPVRYSGTPQLFEQRRSDINKVLAFSGVEVHPDGKLRTSDKAKTLDEAAKRAHRLREELLRRQVHSDILRFCRAELLEENYFHAVFEAAKSVADKIRERSGRMSDGAELVDEVFALKSGLPVLAFNSLQSETECSEHNGLANLLRGLFGTFRNTMAHAPKVKWAIHEQDALDMLSLSSLLHRRLDKAVPTGRP